MRIKTILLAACLATLAPVMPVSAHHSTAMYDMANPVTVTGTVKRFEWTNPHAFIFLDVTDEKGQTVEWEVEMMSLNHLRSYGWMRTTVKAGDRIICTGGRARSGAPSMISALIELPDGRKIRS
jgi:DNA/RNA endonuclease YhcR with UshA esterase domain